MTKAFSRFNVLCFAPFIGAIFALATTAGAAPVVCYGTAEITPSNFQVRQVDSQTFVEFDAVGTKEICLADGSTVTGTFAGHFSQRNAENGDITFHGNLVLSYGGGTLGFSYQSGVSGGNFRSHLETVGVGTGPLRGISGQGTFYHLTPTTIYETIYFVYAP